jgi:Sec-independent protein translocase protein TatA
MLVIDDNSLDAMNFDQREQIGWGIIFFAIMILLLNFGVQIVPVAKAWGEATKKFMKLRDRRARIKKGEDVEEEESDGESKKEEERSEHHSENDNQKGEGMEGSNG